MVLRAWPLYWISLNDSMMRERRLLGEDFQLLTYFRWRVVGNLAVCSIGENATKMRNCRLGEYAVSCKEGLSLGKLEDE